jgi:hypothetical protein
MLDRSGFSHIGKNNPTDKAQLVDERGVSRWYTEEYIRSLLAGESPHTHEGE